MDEERLITLEVLQRKRGRSKPRKAAPESILNQRVNFWLLWITFAAAVYNLDFNTAHCVPIFLIFAWATRSQPGCSVDSLLLPVLAGCTFSSRVAVTSMVASLGSRGKTGCVLAIILAVWSRSVPRYVYGCPLLVAYLVKTLGFSGASLDANERVLLSCGTAMYIFLGPQTEQKFAWAVLVSSLFAILPCQWHLHRVVKLLRNAKQGLQPQKLRRLAYTIYTIYISTAVSCLLVFNYRVSPIWNEFASVLVNDWRTICWWLLCLGVSFGFAANAPKFDLDSRRKLWHLCTVAMFMPTSRHELTHIALACALALFVFLEMVRAAALPPFGQLLHTKLKAFVDHRDTRGPLVVSHIYLLLGIAVPVMAGDGSPAGVVCLGLGDTFASQIGRRYGRFRIFGAKSLEGTLAFASIVGLALTSAYRAQWQQALVVATGTALLEAVSPINDNLVLPVYMLILERLVLDELRIFSVL